MAARWSDLTNGQVLVYQPQVNKWDGNQIDFRAALAIKADRREGRDVRRDLRDRAHAGRQGGAHRRLREHERSAKIDFPTLPNRGAAYVPELQKEFAPKIRTISLDRLQASLAIAGVKPPTVEVQNNPPQVIVSYSPAILVPIDGAPVLKPVPEHDSRYQRVINTRALILQGGLGDNFYIHVYDGWLSASSLAGPWTQASLGPFGAAVDAIAARSSRRPAPSTCSTAAPRRIRSRRSPTASRRSTRARSPTELIVFKGQPDFVPIVGTQLLWASNTTSDVLINTANNNYYVLLAGRWFTSAASHRARGRSSRATRCRADFAQIPAQSLAGAVLPTVAGTPQAQEAVIENSIPQTATVPLKNGPTFTPQLRRAAAVRADRRARRSRT